jgi:hypothetical protein
VTSDCPSATMDGESVNSREYTELLSTMLDAPSAGRGRSAVSCCGALQGKVAGMINDQGGCHH